MVSREKNLVVIAHKRTEMIPLKLLINDFKAIQKFSAGELKLFVLSNRLRRMSGKIHKKYEIQ